MNEALLFVYNADSGLFNALIDSAHKALSPQTYRCNLCVVTHSAFGMRKEWKEFLDGLSVDKEFLHRDELMRSYGIRGVELPAVLRRRGEEVEVWIDAASINRCSGVEELKALIRSRLREDASNKPR